MAMHQGRMAWVPALVGFLLGGLVLRAADAVLPHLHPSMDPSEAEGMPSSWRRATLLVSAITLHNIPEGLAVGVTFGAAALEMEVATGGTLAAAVALAIGIGLQNFPEGHAVSMPLRGEGMGRMKSFWYGQLSGFVEPISAVLGAWAVLSVRPILPYALAFAAERPDQRDRRRGDLEGRLRLDRPRAGRPDGFCLYEETVMPTRPKAHAPLGSPSTFNLKPSTFNLQP